MMSNISKIEVNYAPSISKIIFLLSIIVFILCTVLTFKNGFSTISLEKLALPIIIYSCGHILRAIRLGVLLKADHVRRLFGLYFYTTACSAVIPFKLGEIFRVNEIAWWAGSYWRGLLVVWIERVFDVIVLGLLSILVMLTMGPDELHGIGILLWTMSGFVFITTILFFIIPEQLCNLNLHVIRSYRGRKAIKILQAIDFIYNLFEQVRPILVGKIITLSLLTVFIWCAELLAIVLFFDYFDMLSAVKDLLLQFSFVLGEGDHSNNAMSSFEFVKMLGLVLCGFIALICYGNVRINKNKGE